jgi:lysophospholipase L1-like esterase
LDKQEKETLKIVAFGDSLTYGHGIEEEKKWTTLLARNLNCKVINSGICGNTSSQGLARIKEDVLEHKPDYVIINFCMNDHFILDNGTGLPKVSLEDFEINIKTMIFLIKEIAAIPILVTPHRIIEGNAGDGRGCGADHYYRRHPAHLYKEIGGANLQLRRYCDKVLEIGRVCNVLVIDINKASETQDLYSILINSSNSSEDDGVNLNEKGAKFYVEKITEVFQKLLRC